MPFGLPSLGEFNWGQKLLDSINAVKATADAALPASDAADVATSGAYGDLTGAPSLAAVATSGDYADLGSTPTIPSTPGEVGAEPEGLSAATNTVLGNTYALADMVDISHPSFDATLDGVADDTIPFQDAADAALAAGRPLLIPLDATVRITANVNLVGLDVHALGTILVDYLDGPGVTAGHNSQTREARVLRFDRVEHVAGTGQAVPALRLVGLKNGHVTVSFCHYLQLYADASSSTTSSIAYSHFYLGDCDKLELLGAAGTSWINENSFFGGRFFSVVFDAPTYHHNGNKFFHPKLEGGSVTFNCGGSNTFYDVRGESGGTITFATGTHHNTILGSWASTTTTATHPFVVTDNGLRNQVIPLELRTSRVVEVACLDATTRMFNGGAFEITQAHPHAPAASEAVTARPGFVKLLSDNNACHMDTGLMPVARTSSGDFTGRLQRLHLASDAAIWRPRVAFYDANRQLLAPASDPGYMSTSGGWSWNASGYYNYSSNTATGRISLNGHADVAFVRLILNASTSNSLFTFARLDAVVDAAYSDTLVRLVQKQMRRPLALAAAPTQGFAQVGEQVAKTAGGSWTCTARNDSTLTVAKAATDTVLTLASAGTIASADVIGVELDDGSTHWTTVNGAPAGNDVTLAVALPTGSTAAIGRRVAAMRWV